MFDFTQPEIEFSFLTYTYGTRGVNQGSLRFKPKGVRDRFASGLIYTLVVKGYVEKSRIEESMLDSEHQKLITMTWEKR